MFAVAACGYVWHNADFEKELFLKDERGQTLLDSKLKVQRWKKDSALVNYKKKYDMNPSVKE